MGKVLFIGDTHFGHKGISQKFRTCFASDQEHDDTIHRNILNSGGKRDVLWLMGDIVFNEENLWRIRDYVHVFQQVNIVLGNHDKHFLTQYAILAGIPVYGVLKKYDMWLSHMPIHEQEFYRAGLNVHGHVHSNTIADERYFNTSCEAIGYKPISLQDIRHKRKELLNAG